MKYMIIFCLSVALFLSIVIEAKASTEVTQEFIDSNTMWQAVKGPYIVSSFVTVGEDQDIKVEKGAKIEFNGGQFDVLGKLNLEGSKDAPIEISFGEMSTDGPTAFQIRGGELSLNGTNVSTSTQSLIDAMNAKVSIKHSSFRNSTSWGSYVSLYKDSILSIEDASFEDINSRQVLNVYDASVADIKLTSFDRSATDSVMNIYGGYQLDRASSVSMEDVIVRDSLSRGISIYGGTSAVLDSVSIVGSNLTGIVTFGNSDLKASNINLEENDIGLEAYDTNVSIHQSAIVGNRNEGVAGYGGSINMSDNWWGSTDGPFDRDRNPSSVGQSVTADVMYSPWLTEKPKKGICCSSILFVPGLQASRLYSGKILENQLWEPNKNADVKKLFMTTDGKSMEKGVYTRDIIEKTNLTGGLFDQSVYDSFVFFLKGLVNKGEISAWKALPYDWRYATNDVANMNIAMGKDEISRMNEVFNDLVKGSKTGKVTVVTHSNGGLVAKNFIKQLQERGQLAFLDQFIMVAVPEYGTPQSIASMLHGDDQSILGGLLLSKSVARDFSKNMPAAYGLLPSQKFFGSDSKPVITFDIASDPNNPGMKYGFNINSREQLEDFLSASKLDRTETKDINQPAVLNSGMLSSSNVLHSNIDNLFSAIPALKVSSIIGIGNETLSGIEYLYKKRGNKTEIERKKVSSKDGDGTVLAGSMATRSGDIYAIDLKSASLFEKKNYIHSNILNSSSTQEMILSLLREDLSRLPMFVSKSATSSLERKSYKFSVHSPVTIVAYDKEGNRTGLIKAPTEEDVGYFLQDIPGSQYDNFGEAKSVSLSDIPLKIVMEGTDTGTFRFVASEFEGDKEISKVEYSNIPTLEGAYVEFIPASSSVLTIDLNADGLIDEEVMPDSQMLDFGSALINARTVIGEKVESRLVRDLYLMKLDKISKQYQKKDMDWVVRELDKIVIDLSKAMKAYNYAQRKFKLKKLVEPIVRDTTVLYFEFQKLSALAKDLAE